MSEKTQQAASLPGCEKSLRLSDGSIYSQRGRMTTSKWTQECLTVAEHLGIPIEQHLGLHSVEYLAKDIPSPHLGLFAERMIYWLAIDFELDAERAVGTLMASIYQAEGAGAVHPVNLFLQGYNAAFAAWPQVDEDDEDSHASWNRIARGLLNNWWSEIAQKMYQLEARG